MVSFRSKRGRKGKRISYPVTAHIKCTINQPISYVDTVASQVKIGDLVLFRPPEKIKGGYLDRERWFGSKSPNEYNDPEVVGEVIKINPKTVRIKATEKTHPKDAWNFGHEYVVPKDAKAKIAIMGR